MRVWHCAAYDDLILRSALCARLEGWAADTADMTSYPRGAFRPSFALRFTLFEIRGRGEDRVTAAPGALAPEKLREGRVTTGTADITPAFPAQWFTAYSVLSPVNQHLPPSFSQRLWSFRDNLAPASARQDHTTSPSASVPLVSQHLRVHRIPPRVS